MKRYKEELQKRLILNSIKMKSSNRVYKEDLKNYKFNIETTEPLYVDSIEGDIDYKNNETCNTYSGMECVTDEMFID